LRFCHPVHPRPRSRPLLPYTTLFRSCGRRRVRDHTTAPAAPTTSRTTPATTTAVTVLSDPDDGASRSSSWLRGSMREIGSRSGRSEEHTSELQSRENLVCRLLLEKKN